MNEKLYELLGNVQRTAVTVSDVAVDAVYATGKKAGEVLDRAKVSLRIMALEGDVDDVLRQLGEMLYATHTGTPTDSEELLAKMQEIDALNEEIDRLEAQLGREIVLVCSTCGAVVQEEDIFCRSCGDKL